LGGRGRNLSRAGQPQLRHRPKSFPAVEDEPAAGLDSEAMHHRETKPRAPARNLCCKERLGGPGERGLVHTFTGVNNAQHYVVTGRDSPA
jgi:hypothetical protein